MPPMVDLNADGRKDLLIIGPENSNPQDLVFFIIQESFVIFRQQYASFLAHYTDIDRNGSTDILTFTDEGIRYLWYGTDTQEFTANTFTDFGAKRPFLAQDIDNDGVTDVAMFDQDILIQPGTQNEEGWRLYKTVWTSYDSRFTAQFLADDFNEDNATEVVGFIETGNEIKIEVSRFLFSEEESELENFISTET